MLGRETCLVTADFDYPSDLRFTCSGCGDCCVNTNILLTPEEAESLASLDWRGRADDLVGVSPGVSATGSSGGSGRRLKKREDGACIYLGSDRQCRIHEHFGAERKPLMCRMYPFHFYPLKERIAVDCAFSCRAVSLGQGAELKAQVPEWSLLLETELGSPRPRKHHLNEKSALSDEILWQIEQYMLAFLDDTSLSLFDRVRCLLEYSRLATTGDPSTESAAQLRQALSQGLPIQISKMPWEGQMDRTQRAIFFQWLYLVLNPTTSNEDLLRGHRLEAAKRKRIAIGNRYRKAEQRPYVDNRELTATFEQITEVDGSFVEREGASRIKSFLCAKIIGQRYLLAGEQSLPFVEAIPKLAINYPMAIWTSQALAADRGAAAVENEDLRRALRLLDRSLGQFATSRLPKKQARAFNFIMLETDFVVCARNELLGVGEVDEE